MMTDDEVRNAMIQAFNTGYATGHDHTVEGYYVDVPCSDMEHHADVVDEIISDCIPNDIESRIARWPKWKQKALGSVFGLKLP